MNFFLLIIIKNYKNMANIVNDPPTYAKVILKTTYGDLDIELWTKEAPMTCRNFIQLCME